MATTIKTVMTYPLDGSTTDFNIPFEYLARKFVRVTLIGVDRKELILNQDYRFATKTTISTTRAFGPADGYNLIEIRRYTSATERLVDFTDGSILRAYDLNISQVQTLHVAEEARDLTADTIGVNNDGDLDARGRRIVNVADGMEPGDAITFGQVQRWNNSALNSANAAKVSENNAKSSEIRSVQAETRSVQAEARSVTAETNSKNSEVMAQKWAANPLGELVANNMFSSFHYANQANLSAGAAKTSENNSASSASASAASAATSKAEADRAELLANQAGGARVINGIYPDSSGSVTLTTDDIKNPSGVTIMTAVRSLIDAIFPVGMRMDWPLASLPDNPTLGVKFLRLDGSSFNKTQYPKLALIYPSGVLPDLRGEFIRGWDGWRGIDAGREILSAQGDAIRNIVGRVSFVRRGPRSSDLADGAFRYSDNWSTRFTGQEAADDDWGGVASFDASSVVPTASENRPRNIAWNMIVRAS